LSDPIKQEKDVATDASLLRENEMLKAHVKLREDQLKQAIGIANKANSVQTARDEAEKADLIDRIVVDSNRKLTTDELAGKTLSELHLIKTVLSKSMDSTFASIAALQQEKDRKTQPHLTVGAWDAVNKTWIGGT
jgi:LPS O-antigen subunit length determinant protein (WzzB/FepE family)